MANTVPTATGSVSPGQVVKFVGYSDASIPPIFAPGQLVRVESVNAVDGELIAVALDGPARDTVFIEEITQAEGHAPVNAAPVEEAEEVAEPVLKVAAMASGARKSDRIKRAKSKGGKQHAPGKPKAESKSVAKRKAVQKQHAAKATKIEQPDLLDATRQDAVVTAVIPPVVEEAEAPTAVVSTVVSTEVVTETGRSLRDSDRVAEILSKQDALDAAKALVAQAEETYFTLGGVLSHIYYEGIHKTLGYDGKRGFEEYAEKELGVNYRKAMYLINIYTTFRGIGIDERRLTQIGWSKAKELTKFVTPENFDELMEAAETKSREELMSHLRETYVDADTGNGERTKRVRMVFGLFADQAETVTRAIDAAKERVGNDDMNQALEYICAEWLMLTEGIEVSLEDSIRQMETRFGVRLVPQSAAEVESDSEATEATL